MKQKIYYEPEEFNFNIKIKEKDILVSPDRFCNVGMSDLDRCTNFKSYREYYATIPFYNKLPADMIDLIIRDEILNKLK